MGVPITFIDKYNETQFEIVGRSGVIEWAINECNFFTPPSLDLQGIYKSMDKTWRVQNAYILINGKPETKYSRIFIRRKK